MKEQLKGLKKIMAMLIFYPIELSNVRTWSYVANKKIGLKIQIIGFNLQKILKINYQINYTMNLQKVLLIKK